MIAVLALSLPQDAADPQTAPPLELRAGLAITCVAAEPDVVQPRECRLDERGRLWVLHGAGGLRLTVGEDTDGDGVFDGFRDFADGLPANASFVPAPAGVYLARPPRLFHAPDETAEPRAVLDGFGDDVGALALGPDGWVYGARDSTSDAEVRGRTFRRAVWRWHPEADRFEVFARGGGDAAGLAFDRDGEVFAGAGAGHVLVHYSRGGYHGEKPDGRGPAKPYAFGAFGPAPHEGEAGREARAGVLYRGGLFPDFDGAWIAPCGAGDRICASDVLPDGSTFRTRHREPLVASSDPRFRPTAVTAGPDGALFVCDRGDAPAGGRIWRIAPDEPGAPKAREPAPTRALPGDPAELARAARDPDPRRRAAVAAALRDVPPEDVRPALLALLADEANADDRRLVLLCWWAVEAAANRYRDDDFAADSWHWRLPLAAREITPRLLRRWAAEGGEENLLAAARLLRAAPSAREAADALLALDRGFAGRRSVEVPDALRDAIDDAPEGDEHDYTPRARKVRLQLRLGDEQAVASALGFARYEHDRVEALRVELLEALGPVASERAFEPLIVIARGSRYPAVRRAALEAMRHYETPVVAGRVLSFYEGSEEKAEIVELLTRRRDWALELVKQVESGLVWYEHVPLELVDRMRRFRDAELDQYLASLWGDAATRDKAAEMERVRGALDEGGGDVDRGRMLFQSACARCHVLNGVGEASGPDLTDFDRGNLDLLLSSIIDPNARIRPSYEHFALETTNGFILTGRLTSEIPNSVTLEDTTIAREAIRSLAPAGSRMPEGLLDGLGAQDLRDLFAWLSR